MIADILGDRMGCFLFQLPSYRFTRRGSMTLSASWIRRATTSWNSGTPAGGMKRFTAPSGRQGSLLFLRRPAPPDELVRTADEVYIRLHGPKRWYRHDYSKAELAVWAERIRPAGQTRMGVLQQRQ
jgi:uncharacterized protein YecE (DUF72 family)